MPLSVQLLEQGFSQFVQPELWLDEPQLRYVVELHSATWLHYFFRLELCGRLLSFAIDDLENCWMSQVSAVRIGDQNKKHMLGERRIPDGPYGAGPMLIWDHGVYRSCGGTQGDIYSQLRKGCLEIDLLGVRLNGRFRVSGQGRDWRIQSLTQATPHADRRSVLTGRSLDDIGVQTPPSNGPFRLWLEWEHFYTDQVVTPQVVIKSGYVYDLNHAAKVSGIAVGMRLQHVLPLLPNCQVKELTPDPVRQKAWLDCLIPYTDIIQPISERCAVVDLSAHPDPRDVAGRIVSKLSSHSFGYLRYGVGPAIWIAKLAAKHRDPYGYYQNTAHELARLPVEDLLDVDEQDRKRLRALGIGTIGAIQSMTPSTLKIQFGESAQRILSAANGNTYDQVISLYPPKAVTQSMLFESPLNDSQSMQAAIARLAKQLAKKIAGRQAGIAILAVEDESGEVKTLARPYNRPVHTPGSIRASFSYLAGELQKTCPDIVRLTARLDRLEPVQSSQQSLYVASSQTELDVTLAALKNSLGAHSVVLASHVETPRRNQVLKAWRNATGWS